MNLRKLTSGWVFLAVCSFVVGAAVMTIEMTASRVLAPHFGASLFVWTALIVTVLLSMSVGYWVGGRLTRHGSDRLGLLFCGAAASLMLGFFAVQSVSNVLSFVLRRMDAAAAALFFGSLLLSFVVFSVPVFLLAMAGPVIVSRWTAATGDVGGTAGRYFALSTGGSVIGTVMPSLFLVPEFGVRTTLVLVAAVLGLIGWLAADGLPRWVSLALVAATIGLVSVQASVAADGVVYETETPYQLVRVEEGEDGRRFLIFNEGSGIQSVWFPEDGPTGMYFDQLTALPFLRGGDGREVQSMAVLGLAGGTSVRKFAEALPEGAPTDIVGVEIDPGVVRVARDWFALDELPVEVVQADGRTFLDRDRRYDLILSDAYSTQLYIPPHMATREFFARVRSRLADGGLFVMNINAARRDSRILLAMTNTLAEVFPEVHVSKAGRSWNWLVVAGERAPDYGNAIVRLPEGYGDVAEALAGAERVAFDPSGEVLTDDRAPIELMTEKMIFTQALLGGS
ncbi:MAG: fused MFS/spermidine synthase [bacterium]